MLSSTYHVDFNDGRKAMKVNDPPIMTQKPGGLIRSASSSPSPEGDGSLPLVTIVTPSYNQAQFLERTIQSVLDQDYPWIEYMIIDGGSTDSSADIIKTYQDKIAWWVSEPDRGQTDAINKGFERARGEILAWINSDDTYLPGAVSDAVAYLQHHPEVGMVYGDANLIDDAGALLGPFPAMQTSYRQLRRGAVHIPQQAAFFRASLWRQVGPLDPTFFFAMDYDLWVRLAAITEIRYYPHLWANFRLHGGAKSIASDDRCYPEMLRVHWREGGSWFSWLVLKAYLRPLFFAWLPMRLRLRLRRMIPFL